jgi:cold shock CspA family protein
VTGRPVTGPPVDQAPAGERPTGLVRRGVVASFDDARAVGTVRDEAGGEWPFHCSAIADGSRHIEAGVVVAFALRPGHHGRWEAVAVTPS